MVAVWFRGASLFAPALPSATPPETPNYAEAEAEYARARETLLKCLEQRAENLPPETLDSVRENLEVIDGAIEEIRLALSEDPNNQQLLQMLLFAYRKEVDVLGRAARMPGHG